MGSTCELKLVSASVWLAVAVMCVRRFFFGLFVVVFCNFQPKFLHYSFFICC